jgi:hypothetical protein
MPKLIDAFQGILKEFLGDLILASRTAFGTAKDTCVPVVGLPSIPFGEGAEWIFIVWYFSSPEFAIGDGVVAKNPSRVSKPAHLEAGADRYKSSKMTVVRIVSTLGIPEHHNIIIIVRYHTLIHLSFGRY